VKSVHARHALEFDHQFDHRSVHARHALGCARSGGGGGEWSIWSDREGWWEQELETLEPSAASRWLSRGLFVS